MLGRLATTSSASVTKTHKRTYRFMRSPTYKAQATTGYPKSTDTSTSANCLPQELSLLNGHINVGDAIAIS
ncbi:hypothetical protein AX14_007490 [Amanita brunnescens Koide BX004]|nr:hypothetical protein AX14_007490 [Amanita brunnescens Koide BX004]